MYPYYTINTIQYVILHHCKPDSPESEMFLIKKNIYS